MGGLVGEDWDAVTHCYSSSSVVGNEHVGGLMGLNGGDTIGCFTTGSTEGGNSVGGLVGWNWGTIVNCYSLDNVSGNDKVGGLVGDNGGLVAVCYTTSRVSGHDHVGGLVGDNDDAVFNCYAWANVSGHGDVGGLVGICGGWGVITNSYSTSSVQGSEQVGGLVGANDNGRVYHSFWDTQASAQSGSDGGIGKTALQMQDPSTFMNAGWDFVDAPDGPHDIWAEPPGGGHPILWWQLSLLPALPTFSGGMGTADDPYLISTVQDLNRIGDNPRLMKAHFRLLDDIDLTGVDLFIIGSRSYPYTGIFDGNGHTISNFSYTSTDTDNVGLFGCIKGENAQIKDLGVIDPKVEAGNDVGALVGSMETGTITHCYVQGGTVSGGRKVGGLAGSSYDGTISACRSSASVSGDRRCTGGLIGENSSQLFNCSATGNVLGDSCVGGLVGENIAYTEGILIENCRATGSVEGHISVGGLVGGTYWSTIRNCCATGDVTATRTWYTVSSAGAGGLVGSNLSGTIQGCYSVGGVAGYNNVGGLVGINSYHYSPAGTIIDCYSTGYVTGTTNVGGMLGKNRSSSGLVFNSFWDVQTSGLTISDGGTGKTTAEMQMADTFSGWACDSVWTIDEGVGYPRLFWEDMPGEPMARPSYGGGRGTETDPYLIYTAEHLNRIGLIPCDWDKHFKLMADIDLSHLDADEFNIIGYWRDWDSPDNRPFCGVFDGSGYTIVNFSYMSTGRHSIALFGYVDDPNAEIRNLGLINPTVDAYRNAGSLVGRLHNGTVIACYAEGANVTGDDDVGGLVGTNSGTLTNCYATGNVSGDNNVGGLVGSSTMLRGCYATGSIQGDEYVGGLVGSANTLTNCYATSSVFGNEYVGGLAGNSRGSISNCFWDIQPSGRTNMCGSYGENATGCDDSFGLTTAEMQDINTYLNAGWDFIGETTNGTEDIWRILEGQDYPRLWWEK
ncbi:MAG: hypothetical protein GY809_24370 [Planctomycetes bacterium]|nr:hypothetical protein [Planctomycetota bacterium]